MTGFLVLIVGMFVTMVLVPPLVRVSGSLQLLDQPGGRKIHGTPIPRIGGIAIFAGVLIPLLLWVPVDRQSVYFFLAAAVIFAFGLVDDRYALNARWKFVGQIAAIVLIMSAGIHFEHLPFFGLDLVSPWITYPISFLFILGVTNALNFSDGLDGLAGGVAMLSLAGLGLLAFLAGGSLVYLGSAALIGSILGFLRFNTHPAMVFLGDAGSQFLGFALAILSIVLIKDVNPALNPALPLLVIGLPIMDTLSVIALRLRSGLSPFKADNRHLHHRLISLGLRHYEAVSVIYALQALLVALGFFARYDSDTLVAAIFILFFLSVFGTLHVLETRQWHLRVPLQTAAAGADVTQFIDRRNQFFRRFDWLPIASAYCVHAAVAIILMFGAAFVSQPTRDIAIVSLGVAALMVFAHFFLHPWTRLFTRIGFYMLSLFVVYLAAPMLQASGSLYWSVNGYLLVLTCLLALAIRLTRRSTFQMTPQDVLVLFFILAVPNLPIEAIADYPVGSMVLQIAVLLYACEFILNREQVSFRWLRISGVVGLSLIGLRAFI